METIAATHVGVRYQAVISSANMLDAVLKSGSCSTVVVKPQIHLLPITFLPTLSTLAIAAFACCFSPRWFAIAINKHKHPVKVGEGFYDTELNTFYGVAAQTSQS